MPYKDPEVSRLKAAERLRRFKAARGGAAAYRNSRRDSSPEETQKYRAWKIVESAIKHESLVKKPCEVCGCDRSQAHHDDYTKARQVRWFCPKHHHELHH